MTYALEFTADELRVVKARQAELLRAINIICELRQFEMAPGYVISPDFRGIINTRPECPPPSPDPAPDAN